MKINTVRFGEVEIDENRIFNFVLPIIGFNELNRFVLLDLNKDNFFKWLQSVDDPALAFPVVSIFGLNLDYSIDLPDNVVEILKIEKVEIVFDRFVTFARKNVVEKTFFYRQRYFHSALSCV